MAVTLRKRISQIEVIADCPTATAVGDMVYASADRIGGVYQVGLCNIDDVYKRALGMVASKTTSTRCVVQVQGTVEGVYTGLTVGRPIFLGTGDGARLVQLPPSHPSSGKRYHQIAGVALASDVFNLDIMAPIILHP